MMRSLNQRERIMALAVGAIVFLIINLAGFSAFRSAQARKAAALSAKRGERDTLRLILAEEALWEKREAWIKANQPRLESQDRAAVALLEEVRAVAGPHNVLLENHQYGVVEAQPGRQVVTVNVETLSSWAALVAFLNALQQPEQFIVFETVKLQIDPNDPTRMRGHFRIARWFAPAS